MAPPGSPIIDGKGDVNIFTYSHVECKYIYMLWRQQLGEQVREARNRAGLTQLQLAEMTSVKREHISNIELGKNSPAVKIITDIARALRTSFQLDGCRIEPDSRSSGRYRPIAVPEQMRLDFGVEYHFTATSVSLKARNQNEFEMEAVFSRRRRA
jgi:transcriptional regulator with XRE-family HTH domain